MLNTITMAAVYTLLQGFCFNILLPAWALAMPVIELLLGI